MGRKKKWNDEFLDELAGVAGVCKATIKLHVKKLLQMMGLTLDQINRICEEEVSKNPNDKVNGCLLYTSPSPRD